MAGAIEAEGAQSTCPPVNEGGDTSNDSAKPVFKGERPACFSTTIQECIFVITTTMAIGQASFFTGMNIGVTAAIGEALNMSSAEITWITAGASLSSGAFLLSFGKFADLFGRKVMFVVSMLLYTVIVLVAGFAPNAIFLDIFSGFVGLCSAAVVPPAVGTLGAVYEKPSRRKNIAFSCFSAGNPLGFIPHGSCLQNEIAKIYEISLSGDAPNGWKTGYVIALLVIGVLLVAAFLYWQSIAKYPLMPLYIWKDRDFSLLNAILGLGFMGFSSVSFWLALYLQRIKHLDALEVALYLLPQVVNGILVNVIAGLILHRVNNRLLMGIGALSYVACFLILSFMQEDATYWAFIFPALMLSVVGADIEFNVVNMYVMSSLPPSQQSLAGGIFNTLTKLCQNIGLGMTTAIYISMEHKYSYPPSIKPYLSTYWLSAGFSALGAVLVFFLKIGTQGNSTSREEKRPIVGDETRESVRAGKDGKA
ncbi:predicted protein [Uncinocarpus reesii 1704]|uniref:Major facilitator superfamily (MFS) profile domain-containing protein n=1 Tax=Uncinocarpus reesii (strain UAMH 1704) TaxID=336963 RepID=C4JWV9_UNCRE|nr:uncharacterized protein UREG_06132 [Uncinocarpus reesii 1704]EEP81267.1 predicted protein [Uncinocarpus reesii 1704]